MKKITLLTIVLAGLAFASCKKDYTCTCTTTTTSGSGTVTASGSSATGKMSKKDAESKCDENDATVTSGGNSVTTACAIS